MSHKALVFMSLIISVVFLGGLTISGTCLAQSHANNNTKTNKQDMSPGGMNAEQYNNTKQGQHGMSPGGMNAEQYNNTKQGQHGMSPGGMNAEQYDNTKQGQHGMSTGGMNAEQQSNSKKDKNYMSSGGVNADKQGESKQDRELTQNIRQAVMKDKDLSMNAHNVKIITIDGMVTLKGPVASEQEKKAVEKLAAEIAGDDKVQSEINIAP